MEKLKRILAACCCCFLMPQLWSSSCTAEAAGEKKLIRKELHDIKYTRAYGSHVITEYTYNEAGQKIKWTVSTAWDNEPEIETFYAEYNADGTLKREYSDQGYSATYEYYNNGQLRSRSAVNEPGALDGIKHYDPYGIRMDAEPWIPNVTSRDEPIACYPEDRRYQYDDAGRIVLFEVRGGLTGEPTSYEYSYDEQGRLSKVIKNSDLNSIEFLYMSDGGYIKRWKQENSDFSRTWEEEYNENNQIVRFRSTDLPYDYGINYAYDTEGNLIVASRWGEGPMFALGDTKYEYEYGNGVKTVIQDSETSRKYKTEYQYDQDGDLVKISEYECDENGNFEATPYNTELYVYQ